MSPPTFAKRFRVLVRDPLTDAVIVPDLPHSDVQFELRGMQAGATGQNLIGPFSVDLWQPGSDEHRAAAQDYSKLKSGQRIEIYRGPGLGGGIWTPSDYFSAVMADSPYHYYRLDELSGSLSDYGSRGISLAQLDSPGYGAAGLITGGNKSSAFGSGGFYGDEGVGSDPGPLGMTIEAWAKWSSTGPDLPGGGGHVNEIAHWVHWASANRYASSLAIRNGTDLEIEAASWDYAGICRNASYVRSAAGSVSIGPVYHLVFTYDAGPNFNGDNNDIYGAACLNPGATDAGKMKAYVNGVLVGAWDVGSFKPMTQILSADPTHPLRFELGVLYSDEYGPHSPMDGTIDEVACYGTALSPARIARHYAIGSGAVGGLVAATSQGGPIYSGVIRSLPRGLTDYKVTGVDSLQLLQQARTGRTEYVNTTTDGVAGFAIQAYQLTFGDDFSGVYGSLAANYDATGAWSGNVADEGLTTASISATAADDYLTTKTSFTKDQYGDCVLRCWFHVLASTTVGATTQVGLVSGPVVPGISSTRDYVEGSILMKCISATEWDIDAQVTYQFHTNAAITKRVALVFNVPTNLFRCQLQLVGKRGTYDGTTFTPDNMTSAGTGGTKYMWRLLVNGVDSNCFIILDLGASNKPTGVAGVHWNAPAGGSPQLWANRLVLRSRSNVFQKGRWTAGLRKIAQYYSRAPNLDVLQQAAVVEGYIIKKQPKAGINKDEISFGPVTPVNTATGPVNDFAVNTPNALHTIHLIEAENLAGASLEPLSEPPASEVSLQLSPGSDNAGVIEWDNLAAEKQFGILTNAVNAQYVSDFLSARVLADQLATIAGNPGVAKKATVILDGESDLFGSAIFECAPGDWVSFSSRRLGLTQRRVQVVTLNFTESKRTIEAVFDAYPLDATEVQLRRLWQTIDALAAGVASLSPTTGSAVVYDNAYGAPNVMTCYSGYWPVDATHNLQLKFAFPRNIVMIQRITLTFFLFAYLHGIQTTTAGVTSAAGQAHSHGFGAVTTASQTHFHQIQLKSGLAADETPGFNRSNNILTTSQASDDHISTLTDGSHSHSLSGVTTANESTHTHTIPSAGLNAPTSLQAGVGGATGIHVIVDGTDITSALGGPWTTDTQELDITPYVLGGGMHTVALSSTALGGISAQIQAFTLAKSI